MKFNANDQANLFLIRRLLPGNNAEFEKLFESDLVQKIFSPLDACLTMAYDARMRGPRAMKPILEACKAEALLSSGNDCGTAISDQLFRLVGVAGDAGAPDHLSAAKIIAGNSSGKGASAAGNPCDGGTALGEMSALFDDMYSEMGRRASILPSSS